MLFTYKYVYGHEIEKFQRYSDFLFLKVWSRARTPFDSDKLAQLPDLKAVYESFSYLTDPISFGYQFNLQIEKIYAEFLKLSKSEKKRLRCYYRLNNSIHSLFFNSGKVPISYALLDTQFADLSKELKKFYRHLYGSKSAFLLTDFGKFDDIKKRHYKAFFALNFGGHEGICPFCGINHIRGNDHSKLEAYDHLIPKGKYPFNSINFKNLAIMCNECNSAYKHERVILFTKTKIPVRRAAFYPYSKERWSIDLAITFVKAYHKKLKKSDIKVDATCNKHSNEVASWMETFGIAERYKAKLLGQYAGQAWYDKFQEGIINARIKYNKPGMTYNEWAVELINECQEKPLVEMNFLKKPFYQECLRLSS
jgi:hypothetical protein